jgi:hypothetical protein
LERLQEGYLEDPTAIKLLEALSIAGTNEQGYSLEDDIIRFKGRVWVGNN